MRDEKKIQGLADSQSIVLLKEQTIGG